MVRRLPSTLITPGATEASASGANVAQAPKPTTKIRKTSSPKIIGARVRGAVASSSGWDGKAGRLEPGSRCDSGARVRGAAGASAVWVSVVTLIRQHSLPGGRLQG